jgi:hypothetical protein
MEQNAKQARITSQLDYRTPPNSVTREGLIQKGGIVGCILQEIRGAP